MGPLRRPLEKKTQGGSRPRRPISVFFPASFPLWKGELYKLLKPIVILTGHLTKISRVGAVERVFGTGETVWKIITGISGRGEVPTRTDRDNAASLCLLVGPLGRLRPSSRGWSIMPGEHGSCPPGLTRRVVYNTTIPVLGSLIAVTH